MSEPPAGCRICGATKLSTRYRLRRFDVYGCDDCGLLFRHPLPDTSELIEMYNDARYVESSYFADGRRRGSSSPEIGIFEQALADLADLAERGPLLDVGCGNGVFLDMARTAGWSVSGIEISERHANEARNRMGLDVRCGDFLEVGLPLGSFNVITMWDFLEHVLDPRQVLERTRELLAPAGVLLIFTIDSTSLFNMIGELLHRVVGPRSTPVLELLYDARHNYYLTPRSLTQVANRSGLSVERTRTHRAYLGRWLSEPASAFVVAGGFLVDLASTLVRRRYRRTIYCRPTTDPSSVQE